MSQSGLEPIDEANPRSIVSEVSIPQNFCIPAGLPWQLSHAERFDHFGTLTASLCLNPTDDQLHNCSSPYCLYVDSHELVEHQLGCEHQASAN